MRRLCVGDIHGCYDKLIDVLDRCKFSDSDILYSVGDFTDRGTQNVKTLDFLMGLKNFKPVCGNHDLWNYEYLHPNIPFSCHSFDGEIISGTRPYISRDAEECWVRWNGGKNTEKEEHAQSKEWKVKVFHFLKDIPYRIDLGDRIIIHSPCHSTAYEWINTDVNQITMKTLKSSNLIHDDIYDDFVWSRSIIPACKGYAPIGSETIDEVDFKYYRKNCDPVYNGDKIYIIGHTPLKYPFFDRELGIIGIDTGAFCTKETYGIDGYLTVLDMDTFEYWQSGKEGSFQL